MIGSRDLIGAVHVEGESITHIPTHTITPKFALSYLFVCLCDIIKNYSQKNQLFVVDWFVGLNANCCCLMG